MSRHGLTWLLFASLLCSALTAAGHSLPAREGRDIGAGACNACHDFASRASAGYTAQGWASVLQMMRNQGLVLSDEQLATVRYSESGSRPNTVVRFDPVSERLQSWAIAGGGDIVRNTSVTADGRLVLANSLTNEISLVSIGK
jgi:hypothetical protein